MMKILLAVGMMCLASSALAAGAKKGGAKMMTPADLKWTDVPNRKGVQTATAWGNPAKGAHGRFIKFAGGTDNELHWHTNTLHAVVLSGTFYTGADAASAKDLGAGSYSEVPGGWKHVSGCRAGADCVIYEESKGKFDFKPVKMKATK
jgi:quercetin dioxygenase-like cupin family protein